MPALDNDEENDAPHSSWHNTVQQPTQAASDPAAGSIHNSTTVSSSSNSPAPGEYAGVPATSNIPTTLDIGAEIGTSGNSLDIGAATGSLVTSLDIGATMVTQWNKLRNNIHRSKRPMKTGPRRILLLCAGPDDRFDGMTQLIKAAGFEPENSTPQTVRTLTSSTTLSATRLLQGSRGRNSSPHLRPRTARRIQNCTTCRALLLYAK